MATLKKRPLKTPREFDSTIVEKIFRHYDAMLDQVDQTHDADTVIINNINHNQLPNYVVNEHLPSIDEDDMVSDSDGHVPTQQSVKAYVDGSVWDGDIADIDLDGGTDIGAELTDADLILVDDGAGGANRKCALSRLKSYIGVGIAIFLTVQTPLDLSLETTIPTMATFTISAVDI